MVIQKESLMELLKVVAKGQSLELRMVDLLEGLRETDSEHVTVLQKVRLKGHG